MLGGGDGNSTPASAYNLIVRFTIPGIAQPSQAFRRSTTYHLTSFPRKSM